MSLTMQILIATGLIVAIVLATAAVIARFAERRRREEAWRKMPPLIYKPGCLDPNSEDMRELASPLNGPAVAGFRPMASLGPAPSGFEPVASRATDPLIGITTAAYLSTISPISYSVDCSSSSSYSSDSSSDSGSSSCTSSD